MSSVPLIAKEKPPSEYNALVLAINKQLIHIIERCNPRMQVMIDDTQQRGRERGKVLEDGGE